MQGVVCGQATTALESVKKDGMFQTQFASMEHQLQAFGSQLQEARQSTVNFGSMHGNAGRNQSTNNVA